VSRTVCDVIRTKQIVAGFAPSYAFRVEIDPNNPIVKLCAEGISAEMAGLVDEAASLYQQAWDARTDDYDACIVAHYLARIQRTTQDALYWNTEALRHAETVNDERVVQFYPSLYLNMGKAHEDAGNKEEAREFYGLAVEKAALLPEGKYADMVKRGSAQGLERVSG
jgi:tetratricopeptide (TPR) repeat protein